MSGASDGLGTLFRTHSAMARSDELAALFEHPDGAHLHFAICRAYFLERRTTYRNL